MTMTTTYTKNILSCDYFPERGALNVVPVIDRLLASLLSVLVSPLWLLNVICGLVSGHAVVVKSTKTDALGRSVTLMRFACGPLAGSLHLLDIALGRVAFVGVTLNHGVIDSNCHDVSIPAGLISLLDLHKNIGLCEGTYERLLQEQLALSSVQRFKLFLRGLLTHGLYAAKALDSPSTFRLFGVPINNCSMSQAIKWACADRQGSQTQIAFFVNVNSFNIAAKSQQFFQTLLQADKVFADGSGVRISAAQAGYRLKDNVNGTDMLPLLCEKMVGLKKSLYLLGAAPGVAETAAQELRVRFPGLDIAGVQHGYFDEAESLQIIDKVNNSGCSVLLLAQGSPLQEQWLVQYRQHLTVPCALGVGGLFDFYAGNVARAPRWLRELGFEWSWRLLQEPSRMWRRYILGNPLFLYRTYFCRKELLA